MSVIGRNDPCRRTGRPQLLTQLKEMESHAARERGAGRLPTTSRGCGSSWSWRGRTRGADVTAVGIPSREDVRPG
jgi:hypothetical protein